MSDVDPTINGVGGEGFAVDGTDAFAVDPELPAEPDGTPPGSRRGLFLTVATGLVLLLIVVIAGSAGGDDQGSVRGDDVRTDAGVRATTTTEEPERTEPDSDHRSSSTTGRYAPERDDASEPTWTESEFDHGATADTYSSEYYEDDLSLDDYDLGDYDLGEYDDEFADFDDEDFSGGGSYRRWSVPYFPSTRRPSSTLPWYGSATTQPTVPETDPTTPTTPTTEATTTTVADTTTSTTTTTTSTTTATTLPPPPVPSPTLECTSGLQLWAAGDKLIASAPGGGTFGWSTGATAWTRLTGDAGNAETRAVAVHPDTPSTYWVAGTAGTFRFDKNGASITKLINAPSDVRALGVHVGDDVTMLAAGGVPPATNLLWSTDGGESWTPSQQQPRGALGAVRLLGAKSALVGSDQGVQRTDNGGITWDVVPGANVPVVGTPERRGDHISWLRASGGGVVRTLDGGSNWTSSTSTGGIAADASRLVELPDGRLVTVASDGLVESTDGGGTWQSYGARFGFTPAGVAFSDAAGAAFVWTAGCGASSVVRVDDP